MNHGRPLRSIVIRSWRGVLAELTCRWRNPFQAGPGPARPARPLRILAQGTWEHVHPDVIRVPDGFAGYEFWMAFTPYPRGNDRMENPCIRASADGLRWELPAGCPDPLVPPPAAASGHHADPDLHVEDGLLRLVYMTTTRAPRWTTFQEITSRDGATWSEPAMLFEGTWGFSPAFARWDGKWRLWSVHLDPSRGFKAARIQVRDRAGAGLGPPRACAMAIPGHTPWHLDLVALEDRLLAVVAAIPEGADASRTRLFLLESRDGRTFRLARAAPLLAPSLAGWDNRMIYRSSLCPLADGSWRLYYSGASWGLRFGLGLLEGPLHRLGGPAASPPLQPLPRGRQLREDLLGFGRHLARTYAPWLRRLLPRRNRPGG